MKCHCCQHAEWPEEWCQPKCVYEHIPVQFQAMGELFDQCLSIQPVPFTKPIIDINDDRMERKFRRYRIPRERWNTIEDYVMTMLQEFRKHADSRSLGFDEVDLAELRGEDAERAEQDDEVMSDGNQPR